MRSGAQARESACGATMHTHWPMCRQCCTTASQNAAGFIHGKSKITRCKKKTLELLSCVHRFGSVGVVHSTDVFAIRRTPRRFKGKTRTKKKKKKLLIFFGIETKPRGHFRTRSIPSCEPTKCLHISRIDLWRMYAATTTA